MNLPVALQLYSVRDEMEKDFIGTLKKVAGIGYKGVEFAGFGDISAVRLKEVLDELGLIPVGSHTDINMLSEKLDDVIEYNLTLANKYIVCPCSKFDSKEDIARSSELHNKIGEKIRASGLEFLYHNHSNEFKKYDGEYVMDILLNSVKPGNMSAEIDSGWVFYAGIDPADYIKSNKGRCPLIHIKDFTSIENNNFTEIGRGIVDVKAIAAAAVEAGSKWLIVEQDECNIPSLESVRISFENMKKMGLA